MITYNDCLIQAEACLRIAGRASEEADRELLLRMARRWLDAANQLSADLHLVEPGGVPTRSNFTDVLWACRG